MFKRNVLSSNSNLHNFKITHQSFSPPFLGSYIMAHLHALTKFRPVLTLEQIEHIIHSMDRSQPEAKSVLKVLIPLVAKIEVGAINPAYKLSETHLIKQTERSERERYENDLMSPEEETEYESKIFGGL
jgi:hypothetical protein